jgi:hypothetical protein
MSLGSSLYSVNQCHGAVENAVDISWRLQPRVDLILGADLRTCASARTAVMRLSIVRSQSSRCFAGSRRRVTFCLYAVSLGPSQTPKIRAAAATTTCENVPYRRYLHVSSAVAPSAPPRRLDFVGLSRRPPSFPPGTQIAGDLRPPSHETRRGSGSQSRRHLTCWPGWIYVNPRPCEGDHSSARDDIGILGGMVLTTDGQVVWASP